MKSTRIGARFVVAATTWAIMFPLAAAAQAQPAQPAAPQSAASQPIQPGESDTVDSADAYYLRACAMCPALLGAKGEAIDRTYGDRALRFCCDDCRKSFERDPKAALSRIDALIIADQLRHYPLKVSLFDGRPLGDKPVDFVWGNRLFRACDAAERERILADPAVAIRKLDRAVIAAQTPTYGMPDKCPVQGDILPTDRRIDVVVANRMVRVCCARCARMVQARPYQYLSMVEYANRAAAESDAQTKPDGATPRP